MNFEGVLIEESLEDKTILDRLNIVSTEVEKVTDDHKTPWVSQWTLHTININPNDIDYISSEISEMLDSKHNWYADFKNDRTHYIIFRDKVFVIDRSSESQYAEAIKYGISIGIPAYQVDFSPHVKQWDR